LAQLPKDICTEVLRRLAPRERSRCVRVSSTWRAAAAAATTSISMPAATQPKLNSVARFLRGPGGQHVTSLKVEGGNGQAWPLLAGLPGATRLLDLSVVTCRVQLASGPGSQQPEGLLQSLSSDLTSLCLGGRDLEEFNIYTDPDVTRSLGALSRFTALRELRFCDSQLTVELVPFPAGVVSALRQLTRLDLQHVSMSGDAAANLSRLTGLQELSLSAWQQPDSAGQRSRSTVGIAAAAVGAISGLQRLSHLEISGGRAAIISNASTPGFSTLTALRSLRLEESNSIDPAVLAATTGLQDLCLDDTLVAGGPGGTTQLLALLALWSDLERLELFGDVLPPASAAHYSAMTASSQLQVLNLTCCVLPAGAWQAMFGAHTQPLPHLHDLCYIGAYVYIAGGDDPEPELHTQDLVHMAR
jgi:hypothetical protein